MANYGIKVTQDGDDVSDALDRDLVLSSSHNQLKMAVQGSITLAEGYNYVYHNLGYVPQYMCFIQKDDGTSFFASLQLNAFEAALVVGCDDEKLTVWTPSAYWTNTAYYYIFIEEV